MSPRPAVAELPVRHYGSNSHGDYYKVNEKFNVIHLAGFAEEKFICLDCRENKCDHVEATIEFIQFMESGEVAS